MNSLSTNGNAGPGLISRTDALKAATEFVRNAGQVPPIKPDSGRPFVLDVFSREWHVVFEEEPDPYLSLLTGALRSQYRRVAVHAETGTCRWIEEG